MTSRSAKGQEQGPVKKLGEKEFIALIATIGGTTALAIDMILPAFGAIRLAFGMGPDSSRVALTVTSYFVGIAIAQILYGPLADRFGRKPVLLFGLGLYGLGAVASAFAPSFGFLVAARFIWGVGGAGPRVLSLAIARDLYQGDPLARILALAMAAFMLTPAIAPLLGEAVLSVASWRWVVGGPAVLVAVLAVWTLRLPESLPERRPLDFRTTAQGFRAVVSNRKAFGFALSSMFDLGSFAVFLGSSQLLFDRVYGREGSFAVSFAGMSVVMGVFVFLGSKAVDRLGSDRVLVTLLPVALSLSLVLLIVSILGDGAPPFWVWFGLITVLNATRTLLTPVLNASSMAEMGELAGTASAVIGTISLAGGALLASFIDRLITDSVTPLSAAYFGYGACGLIAAFWARGGLSSEQAMR